MLHWQHPTQSAEGTETGFWKETQDGFEKLGKKRNWILVIGQSILDSIAANIA